jgi:predicted phosphoribosyltransferase
MLTERRFRDRVDAGRALAAEIVPGASHLFQEPGTLEEVARLTAACFVRHLRATT